MAQIPQFVENTGLFLPTTFIWDAARLSEINVNSDEFKDIIVRLHETTNSIALALNLKDTGYYVTTEFVSGQLLFSINPSKADDYRQGYRKVINVGALPGGVTTVLHGLDITTTWSFYHIVGAANNTTTNDYYPIPFAGAAGAYISVRLNATQLVIDNNSGVVFLDAQVTLEFVKS